MILPELFENRMNSMLCTEYEDFKEALSMEAPVSIRLNLQKTSVAAKLETVPWCDTGFYLEKRPLFTMDPLFHAGCYYVQEASSMFLEQAVKQHLRTENPLVLDLCAAPGGKSTHLAALLASLLNGKGLLVSNEIIRSRAWILAENLTKWGAPNVVVTNNDPKDFAAFNGLFDMIVIDVPCSGEGMFRKDPVALKEWSVHHVRLCAERQKRIVADSWPALNPGGLLIYSTCTYNREENEEIIAWICRELGAEPLEAPRRFLPHQTKGEGFCIAAVRKTGAQSANRKFDCKTTKAGSGRAFADRKNHLLHPEQFAIFPEQNRLLAIPEIHTAYYAYLNKQLKIISAGIVLGEPKGRDFIPAPELALSTDLAADTFPNWEVDKATALRYLRKEALQEIPTALHRGYLLIRYCQHPLGFVKNIGTRANNLYPHNWRIRVLST